MVVSSPTNLDVTLLLMSALVVNQMMTVLLPGLTAMLMVLAKIAESKETMEPDALGDLSLMGLLQLLPPTQTVILSLVSVLTSVFKTLIVLMLATPSVNLNVVVASNVLQAVTVLSHNGEELRRL